jgi:indoleacetamide hydrolase
MFDDSVRPGSDSTIARSRASHSVERCPTQSKRGASARFAILLLIFGLPYAPEVFGQDGYDILELSATEVLQRFDRGELTSTRYVSAVLARANDLANLNVFISMDPAAALEAARRADRRRWWRHDVGRLEGLPIIVKDNFNSADLPTTAGTPGLRNNQPSTNAAVLQTLLDEGAILVGKANMHELALGVTSNNAAFGAVRNPYNTLMIPGGSSGGTAAAIAARIVPLGLGTDTAGSVRIPAALSGTVGFRPSADRYSRDGTVLLSTTQDRVGSLARTVEDLVLLDRVLSERGSHIQRVHLRGLRLGIDRSNFAANLDPAVRVVFEQALSTLRDRGVAVVEVSLMSPANFLTTIGALRFSIGFYEAPRKLSLYLQSVNPPMTLSDLAAQIASPDVRMVFGAFFLPGAPAAVSLQTYQSALMVRENLRTAYSNLMTANDLDGLILPTTVLPARPIGQDVTVQLNGQAVPTTLIYSQNVVPAAYAGLAGLSLPIGLTADGLPVGLEIDGLEGQDEHVLGIGLSLERAFGRLPGPPQR